MNWNEHIVSNPDILMGKLTFKGTRLSVELIAQHLGNGWSFEDLQEAYPHFTTTHLQAFFAYISDMVQERDGLLMKKAA